MILNKDETIYCHTYCATAFKKIFEEQATLEGVGGPICNSGAITVDIHIIEESYLYIMLLKHITNDMEHTTPITTLTESKTGTFSPTSHTVRPQGTP